LRIAAELIAGYTFKQPFHLWLQELYRQNKQFGSKDRKFFRDVFYGYWKLGSFGKNFSVEQKLLAGLVRLQSHTSMYDDIVQELFPDCSPSLTFDDLQKLAGECWKPYSPFSSYVSERVDVNKLDIWFGDKAPVWVKTNPRFQEEFIAFLNKKSIVFESFYGGIVKTSHENLAEAILKGWCRIQDLGSQESLTVEILSDSTLIWDACCGAGGKTLLAKEMCPEATLYISDIRSQMVHNALQRFSAEGKPPPFSSAIDLSASVSKLVFDEKINITKPVFDTIICDLPCSGSGTWRRTPEMLHIFSGSDLEQYAQKQCRIVKNASAFLKPGGKLIYMTCSVFSAENEQNTCYLAKENGLTLISEEYCGGYDKDADFIYRAVLRK